MEQKRVQIEQKELEKVVESLRSSGYTNSKISEEIGARIDSYLYNNYRMSKESFERLEELYNEKIKHEIEEPNSGENYRKYEITNLKKNTELAELFGIILGDGHLQEYQDESEERYKGSYFVEITLNESEKELINRTKSLLKDITKIEPKEYDKNGKAIRIVVHSKEIVEKFKNLGLESGNKKENQVNVPRWIKKDENYSKSCLKGLIDTDGSIYQDCRDSKSYLRVQFKNHSNPLLNDFSNMCEKLDIKVVKGGKYQLQISRSSINKFIQKIDPLKAKQVKIT
jgi:intein/homing endonuclease